MVFHVATGADRLRTFEAVHDRLVLPTIMAWLDGGVVAARPYSDAIGPFKLDPRCVAADATGSMSVPMCLAGAGRAYGDVTDNLVLLVVDWPEDSQTILVTTGAFMFVTGFRPTHALGRQVLTHAFCIPTDRAADGL